jgi:DNA mismatch repair protein MutL
MDNYSKSTKPWIRPLPERLINKIAAGEVIERPAAVLKELVENSLDAGARMIDIDVEKSGTKLISVTDDGWGIEADQVEIAFSRHATSKIRDFNDLENLLSYGFRGEALPSIGSVSRTRMVTKTEGAESGVEIVIEGGVVQSLKPVAARKGTKVEVFDLFYNTPARRKFLKAETTEARHLNRNAVALALGSPIAKFRYTVNGRLLFSLDEEPDDLKGRVGRLLLGKEKERIFEVHSETATATVRAFLGYPEAFRQNNQSLFIFINDRYIKSLPMVHAVAAGYGDLLPKGHYPAGAVFLKIDPARVDVNVHPTKAEVRLAEEQQIHDLLYQAVKRSVQGTSAPVAPKVIGGRPKPDRISPAAAFHREESPGSPRDYRESLAFYQQLSGKKAAFADAEEEGRARLDETAGEPGPESEPIADQFSLGADFCFVGYFTDIYLIFKTNVDLLLVDQHAAHERVLYEENLKLLESGRQISQSLLFPINIELPPERFSLYEEASAALKGMGFHAEQFGKGNILLSAVPITIAAKSPEKVFHQVLEDVANLRKAGHDLKKAVAQSLACRAAVMSGDRLNESEALTLLKRLMNSENHHCCPHGRPTVLRLTKKEIDGKFGRK